MWRWFIDLDRVGVRVWCKKNAFKKNAIITFFFFFFFLSFSLFFLSLLRLALSGFIGRFQLPLHAANNEGKVPKRLLLFIQHQCASRFQTLSCVSSATSPFIVTIHHWLFCYSTGDRRLGRSSWSRCSPVWAAQVELAPFSADLWQTDGTLSSCSIIEIEIYRLDEEIDGLIAWLMCSA